ncbi:putative cupredoxin [Lupinus albus]|uniref:Putative cupredoxin n=1 Tax=Lupinus albus TaxID=3870 RepID=A0A6A4MVY8_LUPAL|nr:putative cupredoxin [Lupinus albus]
MKLKGPITFFLVLFTLLSSSQAYKFYVGGKDGWVLNPSVDYSQWSGRNRFQVSDSLVFKYNKGSNSVLEVNKDDYEKCNKEKPIKKFENGDTEFQIERSGPYYFISGKNDNCEKGQKLTVVVLAVRSPPPKSPLHSPPNAPPQVPSTPPKTPSPKVPSPPQVPAPVYYPPIVPTPQKAPSPYVPTPPQTPSPRYSPPNTPPPPPKTPSPRSQPPYFSTSIYINTSNNSFS